MHVGRCGSEAVHQASLRIHPDVQLHPEVVLVPLLHLAHLRVPLPGPVLGGGRRFYDGGVHYGSLSQSHPVLFQVVLDFRKQPLSQVVFFQQVAKVQDGALIRNRLRQSHSREAPY